MLNERNINALIGLLQRGKITVEDIKDEGYREAVKKALGV